MTNEELTTKYQALNPLAGLFTVLRVDQVNHKPHPFMVGAKAVEVASRRFGGILTPQACDVAGCDWREGSNPGSGRGPRCGLPTGAHTSDRALLLSLVRHLGNREAVVALQAIKADLEADHIDGICFVDTPGRFRVAPPEPTP